MAKKNEEPAFAKVSSSHQPPPNQRVLTAEGWKRLQARKRTPSKKTAPGKLKEQD